MKLAMALVVRDEADILRANLTYHFAKGVDHVFVIDNGSVDGTVEILETYARDGRLTLEHEPADRFEHGAWFTRLAHRAREDFGADWIIPNDADEFWRPAAGDLKTTLAGLASRPWLCRRVNMIGDRRKLEALPWHEALRWRMARPPRIRPPKDIYRDRLGLPYFYYGLPPKVVAPGPGLISISDGGHAVVMADEAAAEPSDAILIHHYPIRSKASFAAAAMSIGGSTEADPSLPPTTNWKSRRWFRMIEADGDADRAFAEALPDRWLLLRDRLVGRVVRDDALIGELRALGAVS